MPVHKDFHSILDSMTGQYCDGETDDTKKDQEVEGYPNKTCKKALSVFYASCNEKGLDYTKPMPKKVEEGKFTFLVDSLIITEGVAEGVYKAHGFALHPVVTYHPGEPPRAYSAVKEEIIKAAGSLKGKHFDIDHNETFVNPEVNVITDAKWNTEVEAVEFWAQIDDYLYELVQGGCPVSVSIDWLIPDQGGIKVVEIDGEVGIAPYGFEFSGLSILQQLTPGDPNAMIELLMESISRAQNNGDKKLRKQNENSKKPPKTSPEDLEEQGAEQPVEITPAVPKTAEEVKARIEELAKRRAEISEKLYPEAELSDDERAALKAEQEVIWSEIAALEKALGDIIAAQAMGQLPEGYQIKVLHEPEDEHKEPSAEKSEKEKFIEQCMAGEDGKTEEQCETEWAEKQKPPESTTEESTDLVALRKEIVGLKAKVTELLARVEKLEKAHGGAQGNLSESLLKNSKEPTIKVTNAIKILEGLLPSPMVERSSMGMQRECQAIRGAVLQLKEMLKSG